MILGVIADDFTGASDVASMLVRNGMRAVQTLGVPAGAPPQDADALVVALKSRTCPAAQAVRDALAALAWLARAGARQFYFKYCSTFDSTAQGNIGPVAQALMQALNTDLCIACPALPENGRSVFMGHLFVGQQLLGESGMRDHPLTPMTDSNLVRVLQAQVVQARVGLADYRAVRAGVAALAARLHELRASGHRFAVVDASDDADLRCIAAACADLPLISAGSGVALGLPAVYAARGWLAPEAMAAAAAAQLPAVGGGQAVLSGSCSAATRAQVAHWIAAGRPALRIDPLALAPGAGALQQALEPVLAQWRSQSAQPTLFYATADPAAVRAAQQALGVQAAGELIERALAQIARSLVAAGVRRLVVAGGETAGAVVQALGVQQLRIGPCIDPGVPWTWSRAEDGTGLLLALKSGNFGGADFFAKALALTQ